MAWASRRSSSPRTTRSLGEVWSAASTRLHPRGRLLELDLQGTLPAGVARLGVEPSSRPRQGIRQDRAQPGQPFGLRPAPELGPPLMGVEDRLLDNVGGVQLA